MNHYQIYDDIKGRPTSNFEPYIRSGDAVGEQGDAPFVP